ncbi:hypothetical protein [Streptomyces flavofungini]|uniref:hypothetical protein n=1 Tax=Streptomyces flavofungini TaxID=68200 RepID=UPI00339D3D86
MPRLALTSYRGPYADVVDAVCRTLPGPSPATRAAALCPARSGPPAGTVGLLPFPARAPDAPHAEGTCR